MSDIVAFYNEIDPAAAAWLRWLIDHGHIAPGVVDTRSITEIQPHDLDGFTQVHFFAGIGGWSHAARLAGWPDDRPLWTGSCPCQPFSVAGKGAGSADARHLWPDFHRLISARRPTVVMGEQVAGAAGYGWFDGVAADLASENYASRYVDIPSCAVDAPHIRQRGYWIAVANAARCGQSDGIVGLGRRQEGALPEWSDAGAGELADSNDDGRHGQEGDASEPSGNGQNRGLHHGVYSGNAERRDSTLADAKGQHGGRNESQWGSQGRTIDGRADARCGHAGDVGDAIGARLEGQRRHGDTGRRPNEARPVATANGTFWSDADWLTCHDGKARRAQPGISMLVDGLPGRVAAWRGFGNAINPVLAAEVIAAFLDVGDDH